MAFESATASESATLKLPEGAFMQELTNLSSLRDYVSVHAENWYKFVNDTCCYEANNGDVRLIVGFDKATSWEMIMRSTVSRPIARLESNGEHPQPPKNVTVEAVRSVFKPYPPKPNSPRNQAMFVRTLNVMLSNELWEELFPKKPAVNTGVIITQTPIGPVSVNSFLISCGH